jgi:fumarylpyruvate hydrolase
MLKAWRMIYAFEPPLQPSVAIAGSDARFPVRRIFCVGRNYAEHVRELGNDPNEQPLFFTTPADAVVENGAAITYPANTADWHHEVELVIAIGKSGENIAESAALDHAWGYGVGVDLTLRDRQSDAKKGGKPWDVAKAGDNSAPISALTPVGASGHPSAARIWLSVNGETRQDANTEQMIWTAPAIISALSRIWTLRPGDLIFTGSPAGVGALQRGDAIACGVEGLSELRFSVSR